MPRGVWLVTISAGRSTANSEESIMLDCKPANVVLSHLMGDTLSYFKEGFWGLTHPGLSVSNNTGGFMI